MSLTSTIVQPTMVVGALPPPPGIVPNFVDPYSIADAAKAVSVLYLVLTTLTTAIRLYTKFCILKAHGWADYTMFIAWASFIAWNVTAFKSINYGIGTHQWNVPITNVIPLGQWANAFETIYPFVVAITKLSICLQYIDIFVLYRGTRFWLLQGFIWTNMSYFTASLFATIFQCSPRAKIWNPELPGTCIEYQAVILATGIFNIVSDIFMLVFPITCVWNLQMSNKRKLGVSAVFFVGIIALACSLLRIILSSVTYDSPDQTFYSVRVTTCIGGEVAAGILAGNLVVFPRFFATYSSKAMRLFSRHGRHASSKPLADAKQPRTLSPGNYVELKDQRYKARGQAPYADGSFPSITDSIAHGDSHTSFGPYEFAEPENEAEEGNRICKTGHIKPER